VLGERARRRRIATLALVALLATLLPSDAFAKTVCPPPVNVEGQTAVSAATTVEAPSRGRRAKARQRAAARQHRAAVQLARRRKLRLVLEGAPATLSFGLHRDVLDAPIVIKATPPLPRGIRPADIRLEAPGDMHRLDDNIVSVQRIVPVTSRPRITHTREKIYFSVCVDGHDVNAGSYLGSISVSGPTPSAHVDVPLTVTVKDAGMFLVGVALAVLVAALFLVYKELRNDDKVRFAAWRADQGSDLRDEPTWRERRQFFVSKQSQFGLDWVMLELLVPLGAAFAAMYAIYGSNLTWGSDLPGQVLTLVTTAFTAAGVRSLITAATPRVGRAAAAVGDGGSRSHSERRGGSRSRSERRGGTRSRSERRSGTRSPAARRGGTRSGTRRPRTTRSRRARRPRRGRA